MIADKIVCSICKKELQEEENCPKCGPEAPKIYEKNIELVIKADVTMGIRKINKSGTTEIIEEYDNGKIKRYDAKIYDGEIFYEIEEERKVR